MKRYTFPFPFPLAGVVVLALALVPVLSRAGPAEDLSQARSFQSQSQWAASESVATAALHDLERSPAPDSIAMAEALCLIGKARMRGVGFNDSTGIRAATRCLAIRERRLGPRHEDVATAHDLVGDFLVGIGKSDSAMTHIRLALDIRRERLAPDDTLIADSWNQLAIGLRDQRDFPGAIEAWDHAIAIRERAQGPDHPSVALYLADAAICWSEQGDLDRARTMLHRSLEIFERSAPDHVRRWVPYNNLSDIESQAGNTALSVDLVHEGLRLAERYPSANRGPIITLRTNLGIGLTHFRDYEGAYVVFSELVPAAEARYGPNHWRTLWIRANQALAACAALDTAGLRLIADVEAAIVRTGGPALRFLGGAQGYQAAVLLQEGKAAEARVKIEQSIRSEQLVRQSANMRSDDYLVYVPVLEALRDTAALDNVRRDIAALIEQQAGFGAMESDAELWYSDARAARALGLRQEAWDGALKAEQISRERVRLNLEALPNLRGVQLVGGEAHYVDLVVDLAKDGPREWRSAAWDRLVRSRGLATAEMARRKLPTDLRTDTLLTGAHGRWIETQRRLAQMTVRASGTSGDSLLRAQLEVLRTAAERAEETYAKAMVDRGAHRPLSEVGLADVRTRLGPGEALVSLLLSQASRVAVIRSQADADSGQVLALITRGSEAPIALVDLGRMGYLREPIDRWRTSLAAAPGGGAGGSMRTEEECRRLGERVRKLLWDPIAAYLEGVSDVYLVGEGPVVDLPWHALPKGDRSYLVESGPRLHILNAERELVEEASPPASPSLLAVGAPDYDRAGPNPGEATVVAAAVVRAGMDPCAAGPSRLSPLPQTRTEVEAVAQAWESDPNHRSMLLLGPEASEAAVKRAAPGGSVLHIATHGVVAPDRCVARGDLRGVGGVDPLLKPDQKRPSVTASPNVQGYVPIPSPWMGRRVWLALAGANHAAEHDADENEGLLTGEEVLTLDLTGTDWVVLSACHSGLGESWSREGTIGIRRAFALAGARTVIASAWSVEDNATREWMSALYEARAHGANLGAQATESASRAILAARRAGSRSTHPFYWAAFTATGE